MWKEFLLLTKQRWAAFAELERSGGGAKAAHRSAAAGPSRLALTWEMVWRQMQ